MNIKKFLKRFLKISFSIIYLLALGLFVSFLSLVVIEIKPGGSIYYAAMIIAVLTGLAIFSLIKIFKKKKRWAIPLFFVISAIILIVLINSSCAPKKPAVYLYPKEDSMVSVKLRVKGLITKDMPAYKNGWNVFATKEGIIDNKYDYLFYEAFLFGAKFPESGWIVGYGDLRNWFEDNLVRLGLNEKEKNQFIDYWIKELPKANYYQIKLADKKFLDEYMGLDISPKPDTEIRLLFEFAPLSEKIVIDEPEQTAPKRNGFTVVEWGGILKDNILNGI